MKILFFDTETTGLPRNYKSPLSDFDNWPRMVQLAWILVDVDFNHSIDRIQAFDTIIRPDGYLIPTDASAIHGITTEIATSTGMNIREALSMFSLALSRADIIAGHNISFDRNIIGCEMLRAGLEDSLHGKQRICTMIKGTNFCELPGKFGYKWPKLNELYQKLFGVEFTDSHNAKNDIEATYSCFREMIVRGIITESDLAAKATPVKVEGF